MTKRITALILTLLLLAGVIAPVSVNAQSPFTDVPEGAWFAPGVEEVYEKGLMKGVSQTEFGPALPMARAMLVTVLYRYAGSPAVSVAVPFGDVPAGEYYADAVAWCYENGIVRGTSETTFHPGDSITRQDLVTVFYRYAQFLGTAASGGADLCGFFDEAEIAPYAVEAMAWAVEQGILVGSNGALMPQKATNRAECATIITRFDRCMPETERGLVLHLAVRDGVAVDLVTGTAYPDMGVSGDYIRGGTVKLPATYSNWTCQMVVDYNEESTAGIVKMMRYWSNNGQYEECTDVFKLRELDAVSNRGSVCIPWVRDAWNQGYRMTIPVQLYAHISTNYEYLPQGDSFWSLSMDSDRGILNARIDGATAQTTMPTYTDGTGATRYVSKKLPSAFTLHSDHGVRELKVYERPLTEEEQRSAYAETGIVPPAQGISKITDGLTDLGSSYCFSRDGTGLITPLPSEKTPGTYSLTGEDGRTAAYRIQDFVQPDLGIDNSGYESVHITNAPETLAVGKQYPLTAYPYPFRIQDEKGKADEFDVVWTSDDRDVLAVIDGLLIAKKPGTAVITATLRGTALSDTVTVRVEEPEERPNLVWEVPGDYVSPGGDSFSDRDYEMTTRAIYAAIDEAAENGYNHIIFPKEHFYAVPLADEQGYPINYNVPSHMTVEFPEGSVFHMMDSELSRGDPTKVAVYYFNFGVPNNNFSDTCENSHLVMDCYYGERYETAHRESEYLEELRFVNFGRKAVNCSVEIRNAYSPAGYFIVADGTSTTNKASGVMTCGDFVSGWLDEKGKLKKNSDWISTADFIPVPDYGEDGYFLSADGQDSYAGKYWNGCSARLYDILWYDADEVLIGADRFQGRGEYYEIPEQAAYFKVSLQQSELPVPGNGETQDSPWLALHDDGSAKMCEIRNTNVYDSACGMFSVVGQTDGLWVHDCYTDGDGARPGATRTGCLENGWTATRHSIISNNILPGYFGCPGSFNTFIHTNFMTDYHGVTGDTEMLRYINNTTDFVEISEKSQAHVFYNTLYNIRVDKFTKSIGHVYSAENETGKWVRSY